MNESITDETSRTTYEYFVSDLFKYINISLTSTNVNGRLARTDFIKSF